MSSEKRQHPANIKDKVCQFCSKITTRANIKRHERACIENPINFKYCEVCGTQLKKPWPAKTCSYRCSNILQPRGYSTYWTEDKLNYRTICFRYHGKQCIICNESTVVAVHHVDGNSSNSDPENIVPLCPTHHQYMHSKHRHLIEKDINTYLFKFKRNKMGV